MQLIGEIDGVEKFKYSDTMTFFSLVIFENSTRDKHKISCEEGVYDLFSQHRGRPVKLEVGTNKKTDKCEYRAHEFAPVKTA